MVCKTTFAETSLILCDLSAHCDDVVVSAESCLVLQLLGSSAARTVVATCFVSLVMSTSFRQKDVMRNALWISYASAPTILRPTRANAISRMNFVLTAPACSCLFGVMYSFSKHDIQNGSNMIHMFWQSLCPKACRCCHRPLSELRPLISCCPP